MKFPNYLKNAFAGLGIVSLIFYTCAAADEIASDNNDNNNPPSMSSGVYQISTHVGVDNSKYLVALNTETGVVKTYYLDYNSNGYYWSSQYSNQAEFVDLTLTH
jgi:hypothetical protein